MSSESSYNIHSIVLLSGGRAIPSCLYLRRAFFCIGAINEMLIQTLGWQTRVKYGHKLATPALLGAKRIITSGLLEAS